MKKIIVLGSTPASVEIIEKIREKDHDSKIILMAFDGYYPYQSGNSFIRLMNKEIVLDEIFCKKRVFYKAFQVDALIEKKILRINFKRKRIFTEEKVQIDFDELYITDVPEYSLPKIKGIKKEGIFGTKRLKDIQGIMERLPIVQTVMIQSNNLLGLQMAEVFLRRAKEVLMVLATPNVLFETFTDEQKVWVLGLEEKGLRFVKENNIEEILGDQAVKAVRLKSGKIMSTELIIFDDALQEFRMFSEAKLNIEKKICVDREYKTNMEDVFALGDICEQIKNE